MEVKADRSWALAIARIAWIATFVVPLVLACLLLAAKAAHASPADSSLAPPAFEEGFEPEEEDEPGEEACEAAEEDFEEAELGEAEVEDVCEEAEGKDSRRAAGPGPVAPEECLLRSAHARVVAYASHNTVRLTVGYTTYDPTTATVEYRLAGDQGSLQIETAKRHLGRSGVLRLSKSLSDSQMSKVQAADRFVVRLHSTEAPASCRPFETEELTVQQASKRLAVWSQKN